MGKVKWIKLRPDDPMFTGAFVTSSPKASVSSTPPVELPKSPAKPKGVSKVNGPIR